MMNSEASNGILKSIESIRELLQKGSNHSLSNYYGINPDNVDDYVEVVDFYIERAYSKSLVPHPLINVINHMLQLTF